MKIHKIQISSFGKLKNISMEFKDGFQVIKENNEYGKSTIMAFINLMFYGKGSSSRDISVNLRKKYMPWDGSRMSGAIEFSYGGSEYRMEKEFAKTAASDKVVIMNIQSGERIPLAKDEEAGMKFFQMDRNGFERSIFIGDIGGFTGNGDKDSIAEKISNLTTTADEDVSAELIIKRLTEAKEGLISKSGKTGELVKLKEEIEVLMIRKNQLLEFEKMQEEERKQYRNMIMDKEHLQQQLDLILHRIRLQKLEEVIESENHFRKMYKELESLNLPYEQLEQFVVKCENLYIKIEHDEQTLEKLTDVQEGFFTEQKNMELSRLETELYSTINMLQYEEKERNKCIDLMHQEEKEREDRQKKWKELQQQHKSLQRQMESFDIKKAEEQREQLQLQMIQRERKEEKTKSIKGFICCLAGACLLLAASIVIALFGKSFLAAAVLLILSVGIFCLAGIKKRQLYSKSNVTQENSNIEKELFDRIKELEASISKYRSRREVYLKLDAQMKMLEEQLEKDEKKKQESDSKNIEMKNRLANYNVKKQETEGKIETICKEAGCSSTEEYHKRFVEQKAVSDQKMQLQKKLAEQKREFSALLSWKDESTYPECVESYKDKKAYYEKAEKERVRKSMLEKAYELEEKELEECIEEQILLNKEIVEIVNNIKNVITNQSTLEEVEEITRQQDLKQLNEHREAIIERLQKMEIAIRVAGEQLKPSDNNQLSIERRLKELNETELEMRAYYDAVSAADRIMLETVQQIRQSFGSELNEKTGEILRDLTDGKYDNVIVNKDYGMLVSDSEDIRFREWKYLSNGTVDQLYLSLRLAITQCIAHTGESLPLFLDDVLTQYDDERAKQAMLFLKKYAVRNQIILFTCHGYIKNLMEAE